MNIKRVLRLLAAMQLIVSIPMAVMSSLADVEGNQAQLRLQSMSATSTLYIRRLGNVVLKIAKSKSLDDAAAIITKEGDELLKVNKRAAASALRSLRGVFGRMLDPVVDLLDPSTAPGNFPHSPIGEVTETAATKGSQESLDEKFYNISLRGIAPLPLCRAMDRCGLQRD